MIEYLKTVIYLVLFVAFVFAVMYVVDWGLEHHHKTTEVIIVTLVLLCVSVLVHLARLLAREVSKG